MKILTFDIGGANIKRLVLDKGKVRSSIHYFPMWKRRGELSKFLGELREDADLVGITMTAELSDAFNSKRDGVRYIVNACEENFNGPLYLSLDRRLLTYRELRDLLELAAANWVASLYFIEKKFGEGILIDVGSTTTDILPFMKDGVLAKDTDLERLKQKQLVYTGFLRTPVNAIVDKLPYDGKMIGMASEYFAISADIYNVLGMLVNYNCDTPDGRGTSRYESMRRLARLLCSEPEALGEKRLTEICNYVHEKQVKKISDSIKQVAKKYRLKKAYICGVGKVLAGEACNIDKLGFVDLSTVTEAHENLPCLGLAKMLEDSR